MRTLGIILTGLVTGFVIMTPVWSVVEIIVRLFLGACTGCVFYAIWGMIFPPKDGVDV